MMQLVHDLGLLDEECPVRGGETHLDGHVEGLVPAGLVDLAKTALAQLGDDLDTATVGLDVAELHGRRVGPGAGLSEATTEAVARGYAMQTQIITTVSNAVVERLLMVTKRARVS